MMSGFYKRCGWSIRHCICIQSFSRAAWKRTLREAVEKGESQTLDCFFFSVVIDTAYLEEGYPYRHAIATTRFSFV
ncbi:unnamed protein product [Cylicocyclus nassatus]|uniref:Uncharacterized protein n=1 Tax=Cylicocyclus nassatus TaxID=53992 RepID=A0AA36M3C0_CYLNA|nr:unnamed protein product [Cylicocyclus nassatus]